MAIISNTLLPETKGDQSPEMSAGLFSQEDCRGQDPRYLPYYTGKVPRTVLNLKKTRWIQISYVFPKDYPTMAASLQSTKGQEQETQ